MTKKCCHYKPIESPPHSMAAGFPGCHNLSQLFLLHSWLQLWTVFLPGGDQQSEAGQRPGRGQVSASEETGPISVPHKPGEGSFTVVLIVIMTLKVDLRQKVTQWTLCCPSSQNNGKCLPLFQSQDKSTGGLNPEPCPICARPLGQEVSMVENPVCIWVKKKILITCNGDVDSSDHINHLIIIKKKLKINIIKNTFLC